MRSTTPPRDPDVPGGCTPGPQAGERTAMGSAGRAEDGAMACRFALIGGTAGERDGLQTAAAAAGHAAAAAPPLAENPALPTVLADASAAILLAGPGADGLPTVAALKAVTAAYPTVLVVDPDAMAGARRLRACGVARIVARIGDDAWIAEAVDVAGQLADLAGAIAAVQRFTDDDAALRSLIEGSSAGIAMIDTRHRVVAASSAFEQMLGYADSGLVGRLYTELIDDGEYPDYLKNAAALARGEDPPLAIERRFRRRDGSLLSGLINLTSRPTAEAGRLAIIVVQDVGALRRSEQALNNTERRLRQAENIAGVGHWEQRGPGAPLICSDSLHTLFALSPLDDMVPERLLSTVVADDRQRAARVFSDFGAERDLEFRILTGDGETRHLACRVRPLDAEAATSGPVGNFCIVMDITRLKLAELSLEKERNFVSTVLDSEAVLLMVLDPDGHVVRWNKALSELSGYGFAEVRDLRIQDFLLPPHESETATADLRRLVDNGEPATAETLILQKDGGVRIVAWSNTLVRNGEGTVDYVVSTGIDVTERKRAEAVIRHQANYDSLTGLPNRTLFQDRLTQAIASARRTDSRFALFYIDLDRFKSINDTLGHRAGDQLLVEAARRLETGVRETDTVARLGGDEFTVIVYDLSAASECEAVARKVLDRLGAPYPIGRGEEFITCSIGITVFPDDGDTSETLMRNADLAMYRAKELGRNGHVLFDVQLNVTAVRRKELERELRQAVDEQGLSLAFQPIVAAATGRIVSVEALLRWHHPRHGSIRPDIFIPIAEETGLIIPLGEWVLRTACETVRAWRDAGLPPVTIGVNVSTLQFHQQDFPGVVRRILRETGLSPDRLALEITESLMMEDIQIAIDQLAALQKAGVHISVDDFGTGYSSLSYLKRLPVNSLKIDRSFIMGLPGDEEDAGLVRAVIAMAHGFHLPVIAEGVETRAQLEFLSSLGCDLAQGYLFGKPVPADELALQLTAGGQPLADVQPGIRPPSLA